METAERGVFLLKRSCSFGLIPPDSVFPLNRSSSYGLLPPDMSELRVVLLGNSWSQRSSVGNLLLGQTEFNGMTEPHQCLKHSGQLKDKTISVINTPDLLRLDTEDKLTELIKELTEASAPGPHVFLLVLQPKDFTEQHRTRLTSVLEKFSDQSFEHSLVLLSAPRDETQVFIEFLLVTNTMKTFNEFYITENDSLKKLVSDCGNRFHVFNNFDEDNRTQVKELIKKISDMVKENGGGCYTNDMLQEAEAAIKKEMKRLLKEKEEEMRRDMWREMRREWEEEEQIREIRMMTGSLMGMRMGRMIEISREWEEKEQIKEIRMGTESFKGMCMHMTLRREIKMGREMWREWEEDELMSERRMVTGSLTRMGMRREIERRREIEKRREIEMRRELEMKREIEMSIRNAFEERERKHHWKMEGVTITIDNLIIGSKRHREILVEEKIEEEEELWLEQERREREMMEQEIHHQEREKMHKALEEKIKSQEKSTETDRKLQEIRELMEQERQKWEKERIEWCEKQKEEKRQRSRKRDLLIQKLTQEHMNWLKDRSGRKLEIKRKETKRRIEARKRAEEEARKRAEEKARRRVEEEARKRAVEEAQKKVEEAEEEAQTCVIS